MREHCHPSLVVNRVGSEVTISLFSYNLEAGRRATHWNEMLQDIPSNNQHSSETFITVSLNNEKPYE
uniref:Uncharacterized protein n=1 Tax=Utricularia reniformis TaxID=192314 RepID=A0A1Y0B2C0_9LAMI|nr:hypothetical protein AEK19_MT1296 [Utricularia reniformis]ART31499.1 hypothetical protein AEK19_MT1296 [Utricularia reniformis]